MKKNKKDIELWLKEMKIKNYFISQDGIVDAQEVNLSNKNLLYIPIQFGKVSTFDVSHNQLLSLRGSPKEVDLFFCDNNSLATLAGAPEIVSTNFDCKHNPNLTSLKHCPKKAKLFFCEYTSINSIEFFDCEFERFVHSSINGSVIKELKNSYVYDLLDLNYSTFTTMVEKFNFEQNIESHNLITKKIKI
jgi:hypothetical protein